MRRCWSSTALVVRERSTVLVVGSEALGTGVRSLGNGIMSVGLVTGLVLVGYMESATVTRNRDMDQLNILIDVGSAMRSVILEK